MFIGLKERNFRLERLEHLAEKFRRKCVMHEEWAMGKEEALQSDDLRRAELYQLKVHLLRIYSCMPSFLCQINSKCQAVELV